MGRHKGTADRHIPGKIEGTTHLRTVNQSVLSQELGGGGGTPLYFLYGDVPLDRVWFSGIPVLNRVYNSCVCVLNRVFIPWTSSRVCVRSRALAHQNSRFGAWCHVQSTLLIFEVQSWTGSQIKTNILEQGIIFSWFLSQTGSGFHSVSGTPPLNNLQSAPLHPPPPPPRGIELGKDFTSCYLATYSAIAVISQWTSKGSSLKYNVKLHQ